MARQRKRKGDPIHGWLNLFKPVDVTSTQAVAILKRKFNAQKVGHGGTLDPLADGILPIAFGEATKTVQWAMDARKEYVFTIRWGVSTASQDAEGDVTGTSNVRPTREQIDDRLKEYIGTIEQVPPKFSAIKVNGQRAYDLARDGEEFDLTSRDVDVYDASVIGMPDKDHSVIQVISGKGFYVRALARDLACDLGCEGHISQLRRTRVGVFGASSAVPLSDIEQIDDKDTLLALLQPIHALLEDVPIIDITRDEARDIRLGRSIVLLPHLVEGWRRDTSDDLEDRGAITICDGQAVALGEVRAGRFEPGRVFVG